MPPITELAIDTDSILKAQKEADLEIDKLENDNNNSNSSNNIIVPTLLQDPLTASSTSGIEDLQRKAQDLRNRGSQLDLLLLKAESYSHFISQNQQRTMNSISESSNTTNSSSSSSFNSAKKGKRSSPSEKENKNNSISKKQKDSNGKSTPCNVSESVMTQPSSLVGGKLMPYQLEGLRWLVSLWENGLSGILADEMGLGKTIQVISLISFLFDQNIHGPFLIIGPLATLPNWFNEFKKWLPQCDVILYHGSKAEREEIRMKKLNPSYKKNSKKSFPVVISSFEICMIDSPFLSNYHWQYVILDEGHRIKNRECRLVKELKKIPSTSRLLLTGTPIQNTLEELWSLLNFVNPQIFDDLEVFQSWFGFKNIGQDTQVEDIMQDEEQNRIVSKLHEVLRPFVLRRLKKDVLLSVPPKCEIILYTGMSALQREYYARVLDDTIRDTLISMNIDGAHGVSQINHTMNLRKVCNHPFLFGEPRNEQGVMIGEANPKILSHASGKFKLLDRLLPRLKKNGHKVLIFSQMTELLNILEDYCISSKYGYCRLDGSTKMMDRQTSIDAYNRDPNLFIFMLSTRAGGLGINLTSADTCIIFDSDWNPHLDSQAQDRCHRIGQSKPVIVYRLLTAGSIEMDMLAKQISKKKLERMTITGGDYKKAGSRSTNRELTLSRLRELLEDDVKTLHKRSTSDKGKHQGYKDNAGTEHITDTELDMIINRNLVFAALEKHTNSSSSSSSSSNDDGTDMEAGIESTSSGTTSTSVVPLEGAMYDIILPKSDGGSLGGIND